MGPMILALQGVGNCLGHEKSRTYGWFQQFQQFQISSDHPKISGFYYDLLSENSEKDTFISNISVIIAFF